MVKKIFIQCLNFLYLLNTNVSDHLLIIFEYSVVYVSELIIVLSAIKKMLYN